jgi:hypothetical protein
VGFPKYSSVKDVFDEFWASGIESKTSMYGLSDVWEGPLDPSDSGPSVAPGSNTALAIDTYKDNVYLFYGGGTRSWLKVVTPDGPVIYDIGGQAILMTQSIHPKYFSMAVINENEVIAGYLYLNLEHQFMAPFGIDLAALYKNPSFSISNYRLSDSAWVTGIRDITGWNMVLFSKASAEDCLPCKTKKAFAKQKFSCKDIPYSKEALQLPGYKTGAMSYTGVGYSNRKKTPSLNPSKCIKALNQYAAVFNNVRVSPSDVGSVGAEMSRYCSSAMYTSMIDSAEYSSGSEKMRRDYIEKLARERVNDKELIIKESARLAGLIGEFIYSISEHLGDNDFTKSLIRDTEWWAPIWFNANNSKIQKLPEFKSVYSLLYSVKLQEEFIPLLLSAAKKPESTSGSPGSLGWILVGKENTQLSRYGKNNMTYFRFPRGQCISGRKIGNISSPLSIDGICGVETRADGVLLWAWKYGVGSSKLKLYKYSNDGIFSSVASTSVSGTPTSNAPMTAILGGSGWQISDYYYTGSSISSVGTEMKIGKEISGIVGSGGEISWYANLNDTIGPWAAPDNAYGDGLLDQHPGRFDLGVDSPLVYQGRTWGNDGAQFSWISGYTGFQVAVSGLL